MEENMEEIQAKQTLLQTEIIDKNYDKTAFINFCLSKKENGDDLNNWTLDELKQIVSEFVSTQNEGQSVQVDSQPKILKKWRNSTRKNLRILKRK